MADPHTEKTNERNDDEVSEKDLLSLAHTLDSFAATLPKGERLVLATIIFNSMDPIERMNWRNVIKLLDPNEIDILYKLQGKEAKR